MAQLFASRAELMAVEESLEDHRKCQEEEATIVEWDKANMDEKTGGLFRGCFKTRLHGARPTIRDDEDGVTRCPNCAWELEDGYCNACGVDYGSDGEEFSGEDLSFSEDDESDTGRLSFSDDHYGHPITDEDADYAALVEMGWNEDISLDEDGHSVHADYEHPLGEFNFGRGAAQGLLGQTIRRNGNPNVVGRRHYASSMLSDVATTYNENDHEDGAQTSNDTSGDDDEDDGSSKEDDGSLQDFLADDDEGEENVIEDHSTYNFSPMRGNDDDDGYAAQNHHESHPSMEDEDGEEIHEHEFYAESEPDEIIAATSRRQRGPPWGFPTSNVLGRRAVLPASEANLAETSNPSIRNLQLGAKRARSEQTVDTNSMLVQSGSGSESSNSPLLPQRSRKRRLVVDLSDDDSASDVETHRPRKRKSSSSGSVTLGRQSPVSGLIDSSRVRTSQCYQSPIHIGSSPARSQTSNRKVTLAVPQGSQSGSSDRLNDIPCRQTASTVRDVTGASQSRNQQANHLSLRSRHGSPASRGTRPTLTSLRETQSREAQAMARIEHNSNPSRRMRHDIKTEWRRRNLDRDTTARAGS